MAAATSVLERELEAQAAVGIVVDADVSPMHAHSVFHDGKTEAVPPILRLLPLSTR